MATLASPSGRCTLARASPRPTQNMRFRSVAPRYTHICQRSPCGHIIPLSNIAYSGTLYEILFKPSTKNNMANNVIIKNSPMQGKGVFASHDIKTGDFVLKVDDSHVVTDESKLTKEQHEFDLDYFDGKTIYMQEPEKYINHSCNPTVYVKAENGMRNVYAMRNIKKDDEITFDYSINGDNEGTFPCNCGSKNCRKVYQGDFFKLPLEIQLNYLPYLDDWFVEKHKNKIDELRGRLK